jgi:hypothetical protein
MSGIGDNILDQSVGGTTSCQVRDNHESTGGDELSFPATDENRAAGVTGKLPQYPASGLRRQRRVLRV